MEETEQGAERRQYPRVALKGEVHGKIHTVSAVPVINLSVSGALLEVDCTLNPQTIYSLRLVFNPAEQLECKCRVVRSYVHGFGRNERGEKVITYRVAVEFVSMAERDRVKAMLQKYIDRLEKVAAADPKLAPEREP